MSNYWDYFQCSLNTIFVQNSGLNKEINSGFWIQDIRYLEFGGCCRNHWGQWIKQAPKVPFESNTIDNQAVLDRK